MSKIHELTGPEKAAILLLSLEQDQAASVLRELRDDEVSEVVTEIAALHVVEQETVAEIVEVFAETRKQDVRLCRGGLDQARQILSAAVPAAVVVSTVPSIGEMISSRPPSDAGTCFPSIR